MPASATSAPLTTASSPASKPTASAPLGGNKGLDLVLILDATDSMRPRLAQVKTRLKQAMAVAGGLTNGNLCVGVVAFKDYGDDYGPTATKPLALTKDLKAVQAFLDEISADGGGDEPEPIHEAMKAAIEDKRMGWQLGRKHLIVLVGDSPVHASGRAEALQFARDFAGPACKGTIHVIDTGGGIGQPPPVRDHVQPDLQRIAKEGGGSAFLLCDEQAFWRAFVTSIAGEEVGNNAPSLISKYVAVPPEGGGTP
jgi:hypothetical protein